MIRMRNGGKETRVRKHVIEPWNYVRSAHIVVVSAKKGIWEILKRAFVYQSASVRRLDKISLVSTRKNIDVEMIVGTIVMTERYENVVESVGMDVIAKQATNLILSRKNVFLQKCVPVHVSSVNLWLIISSITSLNSFSQRPSKMSRSIWDFQSRWKSMSRHM